MQSGISNPANANPYAVFPAVDQTEDGNIAVQPIVLQGELGLEQLLRAGRLCVGSQLRRIRPLVMAALLFLSLVGISYGLWFKQPRLALGVTFQAAATGLILMAITRRHGSLTLKLCFYTGLQKPEPFHCTLCDDGIRTIYPTITMDDPWSRFTGFTDGEDMILLWRSHQYIPLPKESSPGEGEWQRLRDLLFDRVRPRQS